MPASEGGNAPQAQPPERRGDDSAGPALLQCQGGTRFQCVEDDACELAFEAAERFASALPLALLALEVSASGWWTRACVIAIRCKAQLSWRLPPRSSRWRRCLPELASSGATPAGRASCASEAKRSIGPISPSSLAALTAAQPGSAKSAGAVPL